MTSDYSSTCSHESVLEDNAEGSSVCLLCGQILDPLYSFEPHYVRQQTESEKLLQQGQLKNNIYLKHRKDEIDLITTLRDLWHFPQEVIHNTLTLYVSLVKKNEEKSMYRKKIFAFAFYKTLLDFNCSHSIDEICLLFDIVNIKTFSQFALQQNIELNCNLSDFLQRFSTNLELAFSEIKLIKSYLDKLQNVPNVQPKTLCSVAILHFHYMHGTKWKTQQIANHCEVTYPTMIKNYKLCKLLLM